MRRFLLFACFGLLLAGLIAAGSAYTASDDRAAPPAAAAVAALPDAFSVDVRDLLSTLDGQPRTEVDDQMRDWAMYGALFKARLGADTLARSTHRTAPVRLPYLTDVMRFDYGRGRRAIVDEHRVWLFYDHDDPDPTATVGRLADKVRMELGEKPERFEVFEITPEPGAGMIHIARKAQPSGSDLYGPAYGHVERTVDDLAQLTAWLDEVDDVTSVRLDGDHLIVAGRRFPHSRTRNLSVEDIAALYQGHAKLERQRGEVKKRMDELNAEYRREAAAGTLNPAALRREFQARADAIPLPPAEPGFSLDPRWRAREMAVALGELLESPEKVIGEAEAVIAQARRADTDTSEMPRTVWNAVHVLSTAERLGAKGFWALIPELQRKYGERLQRLADGAAAAGNDPDEQDEKLADFWQLTDHDLPASAEPADRLLIALLTFVESNHRLQCARYDGPLKGTAVAMNLFYTDLLAKLWQIDYADSAPSLEVPGFLSLARLPDSKTYEDEDRARSNTRLWFGVRPEGFKRAADENAIWFEHVGTRVFAAGSDPAHPGQESTPSDGSARALGWWDRHYAAVADYEPQYHLQNQIMKWSVLTGWLQRRQAASYLSTVPVRGDYTFDAWLEEHHPSLRFRQMVPLLPSSDWIDGRECLPLLQTSPLSDRVSNMLYGGVSLGGRESLKLAPQVSRQLTWSERLTQTLPEVEGAMAHARPVYSGGGRVVAKALDNTRWRAGATDLRLGTIDLASENAGVAAERIVLRAQAEEIGVLSAAPRGDGVQLGWKAGEVDRARWIAERGAERIARSELPDRSVELLRAARGSEERALVRLEGDAAVLIPSARNGRVLRVQVTDGKPPAGDVLAFTARDGHETAGGIQFGTKVDSLSEADAAARLRKFEWQEVGFDAADAVQPSPQGITRTFTSRGPPAGARPITIRGVPGYDEGMPAFSIADGRVFVARPQDGRQMKAWLELDRQTGLTTSDLAAIARHQGGDFALAGQRGARAQRLAGAIDHRDAPAALDELSRLELAELRQTLRDAEQRLQVAADSHVARAEGTRARELYDAVDSVFGDARPDASLRRAFAEMAARRPARGIDEINRLLAKGERLPGELQPITQQYRNGAARSDLGDVVGSLRGDPDAPPLGSLKEVRLVADGGNVTTSLRLQRPLDGHVLSAGEKKAVLGAPDDVVVYIDDRFSLNKFDLEHTADYLHDFERMPHVDWVVVKTLPTDKHFPGQVVSEASGRVFHRVQVPNGAQQVVFLRECDLDRDGRVSDQERAGCAEAL